ncbi:YozE family protein [Trichococcus shcherbakoviae]|uniref:UPF0346 protein FHK04_06260 n=1 Tax=Trichococcus shcherbakoviae subsp. psychrophilus TaxID=2585775 RepID=A0A5C5E7F0_9LACT|nr:YozE family protein [Trichococcus shcherbakoviae]OUL09526.1 hypothetical protein B0533_05025 [Sedimentibacter sp. SX930]TNV69109.1 hypothetical protein FHK04_06260 [Trichococcus shcherbakoviae subsp. psychrophilus]
MKQSFYLFILTYRDPYKKDDKTAFANRVSEDIGFPKQMTDYHELADYLELSGEYTEFMSVFDELFDVYVERNRN